MSKKTDLAFGYGAGLMSVNFIGYIYHKIFEIPFNIYELTTIGFIGLVIMWITIYEKSKSRH